MVKRRTGSIKRFGGGFRRWIEGKHPRDARGRFAEVPDVYVPPRTLRGRPRHTGVERWEHLHIWDRPEIVPSAFTVPSTGWSAGPNQRGLPLRADEGRPEWLTGDGSYIYFDPDLKLPVYIDTANGGLSGIKLGPTWWDLTPEERRHALYFAAGSSLSLTGSPYEHGIDPEPQLFDATPHMDLNGYTSERDVAAEAYALLADGDGEWLEREYPGLAEVVRREAAAFGLPIDNGVIADPEDNDSRFEYGLEPQVPEEPDTEGLDWAEGAKLRNEYQDEIIAMVSRGDLPPEDGDALISLPGTLEEWHPLPENLWHVATNAPAIIAEGFKSRAQLGQDSGIGLGGGPSNVVSFTSSIEVAQDIYSAMLEARAFAAGDITMRDLVDLDAADAWGLGPGAVAEAWTRAQVGDPVPGELPKKLADALDAAPSDETWDIYRQWIHSRDFLDGPTDPLFFQTDWRSLAGVDPADIAILEITPEENTYGQAMGAMGLHEWRVHPAGLPSEIDRAMRPAVSEDLLPRRTLYRGLEGGFHTPADVEALIADPEGWLASHKILDRVGEHWTSDFNVASNFARMGGHQDFTDMADWLDAPEDPDATLHLGITIQAATPESGILVPGTAEWSDVADSLGVFEPGHPEAEVTVDRGANLRIEGIWLTITDESGNDTEFRIDLAKLAEIQPLDRVEAIRNPFRSAPVVDGLPAILEVADGDSARYNALAEVLGLPTTSISAGAWSPQRIREAGQQLSTPAAMRTGLSWLGFGDPAPNPDPKIAAAVALMHGQRFGISADGNLTFTLPDGTKLTRDVGGVMAGPMPGIALARALTPELVPDGAPPPWRTNNTRMIQTVLINELDPTLRSAQGFASRYFGYDRNSRALPMEGQHWEGRATQLLGEFMPPETAAPMGEMYDRLVATYPDAVFEDMLPMKGGYLESEMANRGVAAFVNSAGVAYFDPAEVAALDGSIGLAVPTPEGVMAHEFAHRLFAGATTGRDHMAVASYAFEQARLAAEAELGAPIMTGITKLSAYANTTPSEGFAELFSTYWAATTDVPPWVDAWGREFTRAYHVGLGARDLPPLSPSFINVQGGDVMAILSLDDFDADLPRPSIELRSALQANGIGFEISDWRTGNLLHAHAEEFLDEAGISPFQQVTVDSPSPDLLEVTGWLPEGGHVSLFSSSTDRVTFWPTPYLTRDVIDRATQLHVERHLGERSDIRLTFEGPFDGPPPLEGHDETAALFRAVTGIKGGPWENPDGTPSETYKALARGVRRGDIRDAAGVWAVPGVAEFLSTYDGNFTVNTKVNPDYLTQRSEAVAAEALTLADNFEPRPDPLSDRRREKLSTVYGEAFRSQVDGVRRWMSAPPLVHLPAVAEEQGVDVEDLLTANPSWSEEIEGHFRGWGHSAELNGETWQFSIGASDINVDGDTLEVSVEFEGYNTETGDTRSVGTSERTIHMDSGRVDHDLLSLDDDFQGLGIGYAWNRHNDPWYLANGITDIDVSAGMTEGGYAWASDFFTMHSSARDMFFTQIKDYAQRVVAHGGGSQPELISALQALVDISVIEDTGQSFTGWELAHLGYHPAVAAERNWTGRSVLRGKSWSGTKDLAALVAEATGRPLDIPTASTAPSYRDDWHPFWRDYTNPDEMMLSEWVERSSGGLFEWLDETTIRGKSGGKVLIVGGDAPYVDAGDASPGEAAEILFGLSAATLRSGSFSTYSVRVPSGSGGQVIDMVERMYADREGPATLDGTTPLLSTMEAAPFGRASEYVTSGAAYSSFSMEQRIRAALLDNVSGRPMIYGERGLANPLLPALSMPLIGRSTGDGVWSYYDVDGGMIQARVTQANGVREVTFPPESDLQPSDRVQILLTEATYGASINAPRTVVGTIPDLVESGRFTSQGWTHFIPDPGAKGFITHPLVQHSRSADPRIIPDWATNPTMRMTVGDPAIYMRLTNHVDADGRFYAVGALEGDTEEGVPDYGAMKFAAETILRGADKLRANPQWDRVVLDLHDRPSASEIAAALQNELPGLFINAAPDALSWDDEGHLTIKIQSLDLQPSWLTPMRSFIGDAAAARSRFAEAFRRWEKASHPGQQPTPLDAYQIRTGILTDATAGRRLSITPLEEVNRNQAFSAARRIAQFMAAYNTEARRWYPNVEANDLFAWANLHVDSVDDVRAILSDLRFAAINATLGDDPHSITVYPPGGAS